MRRTRWRSLLRHSATSRKFAGSIPDVVIGIFHWFNPSVRIMAPGVDSASVREGGNLRADYLEILGVEPPGPLRACPGLCRDSCTFHLKIQNKNAS